MKPARFKKKIRLGALIVLWLGTAWLLFPLVTLDSVDIQNVKIYLYRSAAGITLMIIFFGKSLTDLLFPQISFKSRPTVQVVLLAVYSTALAGGIIFLIVRIILLSMKNKNSGFVF